MLNLQQNKFDSMDILDEEEKLNQLAEMMEVKRAMANDPSMFVSGWEEDDQEGIPEKDMTNPVEQFLTAAEEGNLDLLKKLYAEKPELLMSNDQDKYTALHRAAYNNREEACKWLLDKGANPESRTGDGWTPLHCAAYWGNYEVVGILLSHGVDVNSRSEVVPLHLAVNSQCDDLERQCMTLKCLLEAPGIEMNAVNGAGDTALSLARRTFPKILELIESRLR